MKNDNELVCAYLIEHVKDLDLTLENSEGDNVLFYAAKMGLNNIFTMIIDRALRDPTSEYNQRNIGLAGQVHRNGESIIHVLAKSKNIPLLNYLRKHQEALRVDFCKKNRDGKTIEDIEVESIG